MEPLICHASGETIPEGAAYITDADGNAYLPEHYPQPEDAPATPKGKAKA